eukprot:1136315-Pelagomonas_calceolata.AAC.2
MGVPGPNSFGVKRAFSLVSAYTFGPGTPTFLKHGKIKIRMLIYFENNVPHIRNAQDAARGVLANVFTFGLQPRRVFCPILPQRSTWGMNLKVLHESTEQ